MQAGLLVAACASMGALAACGGGPADDGDGRPSWTDLSVAFEPAADAPAEAEVRAGSRALRLEEADGFQWLALPLTEVEQVAHGGHCTLGWHARAR